MDLSTWNSRFRLKRMHYVVIGLYMFTGVFNTTFSQEISENRLNSQDYGRTQLLDGNVDEARNSKDTTLASTGTTNEGASSPVGNQPPAPLESSNNTPTPAGLASLVFIAAIISLSVVGCVAFFGGMYCWYKHSGMMSSARRVLYRSSDSRILIHNDYQPMADGAEIKHDGSQNKNLAKLAEKTDYPAYGVTGPNPLHCPSKSPPIDLNLTHNAEIYHYHQQKQRLKNKNSVSSNASTHSKHSSPESPHDPTISDDPGDEENSDGEYTVYECPGLAAASDGFLAIHNPLFAKHETNAPSYSSTTLGDNIVSSSFDYSTTVGGR